MKSTLPDAVVNPHQSQIKESCQAFRTPEGGTLISRTSYEYIPPPNSAEQYVDEATALQKYGIANLGKSCARGVHPTAKKGSKGQGWRVPLADFEAWFATRGPRARKPKAEVVDLYENAIAATRRGAA